VAIYRVLYWQEIPSQVKVEDDDGEEVSLPLPPRFLTLIDRLAMERGLKGADDYLAQWNWSEETERAGSAAEVAEAVAAELEARFPS
jgi:Virulence factor